MDKYKIYTRRTMGEFEYTGVYAIGAADAYKKTKQAAEQADVAMAIREDGTRTFVAGTYPTMGGGAKEREYVHPEMRSQDPDTIDKFPS